MDLCLLGVSAHYPKHTDKFRTLLKKRAQHENVRMEEELNYGIDWIEELSVDAGIEVVAPQILR